MSTTSISNQKPDQVQDIHEFAKELQLELNLSDIQVKGLKNKLKKFVHGQKYSSYHRMLLFYETIADNDESVGHKIFRENLEIMVNKHQHLHKIWGKDEGHSF